MLVSCAFTPNCTVASARFTRCLLSTVECEVLAKRVVFSRSFFSYAKMFIFFFYDVFQLLCPSVFIVIVFFFACLFDAHVILNTVHALQTLSLLPLYIFSRN